jgi:hypothetical protein
VFTDASDESGNDSNLHASTVISEVLDSTCPLISSDRSQIETTSFDIPEFPPSIGFRYPNEIIDAVNTYHGYQFKLTPNPSPIPIYGAVPTEPHWLVGAKDVYSFENPSTNDGRDIYTDVISEYEDAGGIERYGLASYGSNPTFRSEGLVASGNNDFTTNTTGWTLSGDLTARITADYYVSPACLRVGHSAGNGYGWATVSGLTIGKKYRLHYWSNCAGAFSYDYGPVLLTNSTENLYSSYEETGSWGQNFIDFTAKLTSVNIYFYGPSTADVVMVDTVTISAFNQNLVESRGFKRTALRPMSSKSTEAAAEQIAQIELDTSQFPPLRGTLVVEGRIRKPGGLTVPVSQLPSAVGDVVLIENLTDPNTGALGRQGIIQAASYDEATKRATLTIDNNRGFIQQLRNRIGAYVGN